MDRQWLADYLEGLADQCLDLPSKALLIQVLEVYQDQEDLLASHQGQLDGRTWSPKDWQ